MNYRRAFVPNSMVFITVVTYNRQEILISDIGILKDAILQTKMKYQFEIVAICVLKDHFHMIINPKDINSYPDIVKNIKRNFSVCFDTSKIKDYSVSVTRKNKGEKSIWQRRYWEHTIINEEDLYRHIDYIHYNPIKHYNIPPKNWEFSSFKNFVNNGYYDEQWCNFGDKYGVSKLNLE